MNNEKRIEELKREEERREAEKKAAKEIEKQEKKAEKEVEKLEKKAEKEAEKQRKEEFKELDKQVEEKVTYQDKLEKIRDIIDSNETCMVTTVSGEKLISRPMKLQEAEFDGTLWFVTTKDTAKFDELGADKRVNVAFNGKGQLSLSGYAELVEDLPLKKRLWNNWLGKFFEVEYDDPSLVLIKVVPESAEYWESMGRVKSIVETIKALRSDKTVETEANASVELSPPETKQE